MPVDFEAVRRNAAEQGVDLQEITIKYEGLTAEELSRLEAHQEVTHRTGSGNVLAKFPVEGKPLFPHKAAAVFSLGA
jgi:hypothetical protein